MQPPYSCFKASAPRRLGEGWRNGRPVIISRHRLIRFIFSVLRGFTRGTSIAHSHSSPRHTCHVCLFLFNLASCRPFAFTAHATVQIRKMKTTISASIGGKKKQNTKMWNYPPCQFLTLNLLTLDYGSRIPFALRGSPFALLFFLSFCASPHRSPDLKQNVFGAELGASNNESFKFPLWGRDGSWDEKKVWKPTRCDCLWWNSSLLLLLALWPPA